MAVSNNLGMYLPTRDDYISVKRDISDNLAIIDAAAGNMDIIVNGNTASVNVTSGQFVTVLNSTITGVTDGIYKAVANVAAGVPFVAANLSAPTSGALNELVEHMAKKEWTLIATNTTGADIAVNLSPYSEFLIVLEGATNESANHSAVYPTSILSASGNKYYGTSADSLGWARIVNNNVFRSSGNTVIAVLYAR